MPMRREAPINYCYGINKGSFAWFNGMYSRSLVSQLVSVVSLDRSEKSPLPRVDLIVFQSQSLSTFSTVSSLCFALWHTLEVFESENLHFYESLFCVINEN